VGIAARDEGTTSPATEETATGTRIVTMMRKEFIQIRRDRPRLQVRDA
jgi:hypothetical protein